MGTVEERKAKEMDVDNAPQSLVELMENDDGVKEFVRQLSLKKNPTENSPIGNLSVHGGELEKYVQGLKENVKEKPTENSPIGNLSVHGGDLEKYVQGLKENVKEKPTENSPFGNLT